MSSPDPRFVDYRPTRLTPAEMFAGADAFLDRMESRRSVRHFSDEPVPRELIEKAIEAASSAPSGAHRQPWQFVAISSDDLKQKIRQAVEAEERETYDSRMSEEWREALEPIGTDWEKPYLQIAPWLIVVFEELYGIEQDGSTRKNYYVKESVGIACGFLISALHHMGLATLTHTPSPMGFLANLLDRPKNERAFVLLPVGYPADNAVVPDLQRKPLSEVATWHD